MTPDADIIKLAMDWQEHRPASDQIWPSQLINDLRTVQAFRWTIPQEFGGSELPVQSLLANCIELARGDLLATFILSQFQAACQRIVSGNSDFVKSHWLPGLASGDWFATVGISHLTTSRQHTAPAVRVAAMKGGYVLDGEIPWVTGAPQAHAIVIGGTLGDERQILAVVPTNRDGLHIGAPLPLLALAGSETSFVSLRSVFVAEHELIAGPLPEVIKSSSSGGAGSLTTSSLAIGHALGSLDSLQMEANIRPQLSRIHSDLQLDVETLRIKLLQSTSGAVATSSAESIRKDATELALRSAQALLTACKGAGFVADHPAGQFCREALFFLVWSCPEAVANQLLTSFSRCDQMECRIHTENAATS